MQQRDFTFIMKHVSITR